MCRPGTDTAKRELDSMAVRPRDDGPLYEHARTNTQSWLSTKLKRATMKRSFQKTSTFRQCTKEPLTLQSRVSTPRRAVVIATLSRSTAKLPERQQDDPGWVPWSLTCIELHWEPRDLTNLYLIIHVTEPVKVFRERCPTAAALGFITSKGFR